MSYTVRNVRRARSGLVDVLVCDERLRLVHVSLVFGQTSVDDMPAIIEHALASRRPGRPRKVYRNG